MRVIGRRADGTPVIVEVSKTYGGTGADLVGIARHWYYAFLLLIIVDTLAMVARIAKWALS